MGSFSRKLSPFGRNFKLLYGEYQEKITFGPFAEVQRLNQRPVETCFTPLTRKTQKVENKHEFKMKPIRKGTSWVNQFC